MNPNRQRFRRFLDTAIEYGIEIIAFVLLVISLVGYFRGAKLYVPIFTEVIGICLAVLLIDFSNKFLARSIEKKRLILQMGSPDNAFALEAVRQLSARGWLENGSLRGAYLVKADLREADFASANLEGANLTGANLSEANLIFTKMGGAILDDAILKRAKILAVDFKDSTLTTEQLAQAIILDGKPMPNGIPRGIGTIMPNGTVINPKNFEENQG